jgi:hydroxypyruvate isomerase
VLFNAPPGDFAGGERGIASLAGREEEFRSGFARRLDYARRSAARAFTSWPGWHAPGADRAAMRRLYVAHLAWAAERAAGAGVDVLIEPINTRDIPGYFLNRQDEAHAVVAEVGAPTSRCRWTCTTARSSRATSP